jgi:hypothetical protein
MQLSGLHADHRVRASKHLHVKPNKPASYALVDVWMRLPEAKPPEAIWNLPTVALRKFLDVSRLLPRVSIQDITSAAHIWR